MSSSHSRQKKRFTYLDFGDDYRSYQNHIDPSHDRKDQQVDVRNRIENKKHGLSIKKPLIDRTERSVSVKQVFDQYSLVIEQLFTERTCCGCRRKYRPVDNYIRLGCLTHIGSGESSCCKERVLRTLGCKPCIHTSEILVRKDMETQSTGMFLELPSSLVDMGFIEASHELLHLKKSFRDVRSAYTSEDIKLRRKLGTGGKRINDVERKVYFFKMVDSS
jgi:hypothetical protein